MERLRERSAWGELLRPHRTLRQRRGREGTEFPMSADSPVGPAVLINKVGQGRVRFPEFVKRLREIGFAGEFIIEREISGEKA